MPHKGLQGPFWKKFHFLQSKKKNFVISNMQVQKNLMHLKFLILIDMSNYNITALYEALNYKLRKTVYGCQIENGNIVITTGGQKLIITDKASSIGQVCFSVNGFTVYVFYSKLITDSYEAKRADKILKKVKVIMKDKEFWKKEYRMFYEEGFEQLF